MEASIPNGKEEILDSSSEEDEEQTSFAEKLMDETLVPKEESSIQSPNQKENETNTCRVFCVSDIHTDHPENWTLIENWDANQFNKQTDILILAGDISTKLSIVKKTFQLIHRYFDHVFFVPGNNELRIGKSETFQDSFQKFHEILKICKEMNIYTTPKKINGVWIVPLFSWYEPNFDKKFDGNLQYQKHWLDFYKIKWPNAWKDLDSAAKQFVSLNNFHKEEDDTSPVITFSHFLPRFELLPNRMFIKKSLPLVVGYDKLDDQLRKFGAIIHVCGHTHINVDTTIAGVRYVQHALGHPVEQKSIWKMSFRSYAPKLIYQSNNSNGNCHIM